MNPLIYLNSRKVTRMIGAWCLISCSLYLQNSDVKRFDKIIYFMNIQVYTASCWWPYSKWYRIQWAKRSNITQVTCSLWSRAMDWKQRLNTWGKGCIRSVLFNTEKRNTNLLLIYSHFYASFPTQNTCLLYLYCSKSSF